MYLIWSNEHRAWWMPAETGYTTIITEAGLYKRDRAMAICKAAAFGWSDPMEPPPEIAVPRDDVEFILERWPQS